METIKADFAKCSGCRHFEDADWAGCIERVKRTGDFIDCYNPSMEKRKKCSICGSRFVWTERSGKLFCRNCYDELKVEEVK